MMSNFQVPALDRAIPHTILPRSGTRRAARLARSLLEAGFIEGRVSEQRAANPLATCQHHLQAWLAGRLGTLKCLEPAFRLTLGAGGNDSPYSSPIAESLDEDDLAITWFHYFDAFAIGPALERLEQVAPGLGQTVLTALDRCFEVAPMFTPWDALGVAREYFWWGEEDETAALDERSLGDEKARAELEAEMVTRAKVDAAFPAWALKWPDSRKRLSRTKLREIARTAKGTRVRAAVEGALWLLDRKDDGLFRPERDGWFVGYGAILCWKERDITTRIFDDFANAAVEGDSYDDVGEHCCSLDDAASLAGWKAAMEKRIEGMRRLDHLIDTLSTGDWAHVPKGFK